MKKLLLLLTVGAMMLTGCDKKDTETDKISFAKVGDFYYDDGSYSPVLTSDKICIGVVFREQTATQKGLIVCLDEKELKWSTEETIDDSFMPKDHLDGIENLNTIKKIEDWNDKYPAFNWCVDKGSEWYLPSIKELWLLYEIWNSDSAAFNAKLTDAGGVGIESSTINPYWSSTMDWWQFVDLALSLRFDTNNTTYGYPLETIGKVRAIRAI